MVNFEAEWKKRGWNELYFGDPTFPPIKIVACPRAILHWWSWIVAFYEVEY